MVQLNNLAGSILNKLDGSDSPEAGSLAPRVVIVGQSGSGQGNLPYLVQTTVLAKGEFGLDGNLIRGMWEAKKAGAQEIYLYRVGATSAKLTGVGFTAADITGGYTIETVAQDEDAGTDYKVYFVTATNLLVVSRASDDLVVWSNDPTDPIDRFEVVVSGWQSATGGLDIGTPAAPVTLAAADGVTDVDYVAGTDGLDLSRMELYEAFAQAYEHLKEYSFDVIAPMDVYLDDYNTVDQGHYIGAVTPASNAGANDEYPTPKAYVPGQDADSLGMMYTEEYEGLQYYWWRFATTGVTADVFPSVGSATATTKIDGTTLTEDDFYEVNFAYQLGRFMYEYTTNVVDATGVIGVLPPSSASIVDRARWLGKSPKWTFNNQTGEYTVEAGDNGSGLLGNKFMVGQAAHRSGVFGGGFIACEGKNINEGSELVDANDVPIDLGKFFSVAADYPLLRNNYNSLGYIASFAASYAGFYSNMAANSAPTNKKVSNASLVYRQKLDALNDLSGSGYVVLRNKPQGLVVANDPTASMPNSDWRWLSTVRMVKAVTDGVRAAVEPFLGESLSQGKKGALQQAIETVLLNAKKLGVIKEYRPFEVIQTPQMAVAGRADVALTLVPAFELRQVVFTVAVAKS